MPRSQPKPLSYYPLHWAQALRWLASQPAGSSLLVESKLCTKEVNSKHFKLRAMRNGLQDFPQVGEDAQLTALASQGCFTFKRIHYSDPRDGKWWGLEIHRILPIAQSLVDFQRQLIETNPKWSEALGEDFQLPASLLEELSK